MKYALVRNLWKVSSIFVMVAVLFTQQAMADISSNDVACANAGVDVSDTCFYEACPTAPAAAPAAASGGVTFDDSQSSDTGNQTTIDDDGVDPSPTNSPDHQSSTSYANGKLGALHTNYIALNPGWASANGLVLGDVAALTYKGKTVYAVYGDNHVGNTVHAEISVAAAKALGTSGNDSLTGVHYVVYPGTHTQLAGSVDQSKIDQIGAQAAGGGPTTNSPTGGAITGNLQALAQQILSNSSITFDYGPTGPTGTQFKRMASGQKAETDDGRQVDVEPIILVTILHIAQTHKVNLSALTDGASHTAPTNPHGSGKAVDINILDGSHTTGSDSVANTIINSAAEVLPSGARFGMGNNPFSGTKQISGKSFTAFPDNPTHVHIDVLGVSQTADDSAVTAAGVATPPVTPGAAAGTCCPTPSSGGGGPVLTGSSPDVQAFNFFTAAGFSDQQAAGIVGNMMLESGVDPHKIQGGGESSTPTGTGWGIVQFTPPSNATAAQAAAHVSGVIGDLTTQLQIVLAQLQGKAGSYNETQAGTDIKTTTTYQDAVLAFQGNMQVGGKYYGYERPHDEQASVGARDTFAAQVLKDAGAGGAAGGGPAAGGSCPASAPSSGVTGYSNPLRDWSSLKASRVDEGVDYNGVGPVYAIGNGTIDYASSSTGWPGGNFVSYTLSDGPAAGHEVYVAEDCAISSDILSHTVKQVTSTTVLCKTDSASGNIYIETGWAYPKIDNAIDNGTCYSISNSTSTSYGMNFLQLMKSLGVNLDPEIDHPITCTLPSNWPTW